MSFLSSTLSPIGNDLGFSDAYPDYLLGIGNGYFQGSAQHELVRSTSLYLFVQDSWKIKPNVTAELRLALGDEHAAHRHRQKGADVPARSNSVDLSLHASHDQPALCRGQRHRLQHRGRHAGGPGFPRRQGRAQRADEHLLQRFCSAPRPQLESRLERWLARRS